jgi:rubrerythrin
MMSKTNENLKNAFAGESQANRKYLAFSIKAETEGFPNVAKLFRAVAEAETVHALNHLNVIGDVKTTKDNIESAIGGETYEFTQMYPGFIKNSSEENLSDATRTFNLANQVEKIHGSMYKKALESVKDNKDIEKKELFVCQICGNTVESEAPGVCPVCGSSKDKFKRIN